MPLRKLVLDGDLLYQTTFLLQMVFDRVESWAKTIKKNTNSTQNKYQTHRAKQYEVTSFLSTDCELSTETCSKNVYSLGPLSPLFFNIYMDCLSESLCKTQSGCNVGGVMINHLMYVDDLVIISPSVKGLQRLLDICDVYGQNHDILFNHDKTVCMYMPSGNCYYLNMPVVVLNGIQLAFVRTYTYLGTVMTCDNADDANMRRQKGICYARANGIIKNFSMCSPVVKATLFRTFCSNMYCSQLWRDFRSGSIRQLIVGYNHSFRYIMNYPRNCSASGMFVFNNIPSIRNCGATIFMVLCSDS